MPHGFLVVPLGTTSSTSPVLECSFRRLRVLFWEAKIEFLYYPLANINETNLGGVLNSFVLLRKQTRKGEEKEILY
jgi:hypothetical protein